MLCLVALLAMLWPQGSAASNGNAGIKLQKTVDAATLTPILALSLSVDKPQAIPGDTLTYSGTVTNTRGVLGLTGRFVAAAHADTDATVVYYWDELQDYTVFWDIHGFVRSPGGVRAVPGGPRILVVENERVYWKPFPGAGLIGSIVGTGLGAGLDAHDFLTVLLDPDHRICE
ncbi:MAG TPA: hypothetical protein VEQ12_09710 [Candidatus Limnocylindria bacterium]|nr:hypothetical protein [Candidatus Limnocylindria bacterium]